MYFLQATSPTASGVFGGHLEKVHLQADQYNFFGMPLWWKYIGLPIIEQAV